MMNNSLGKSERIKSRKLVEELFNNPSTIKAYPFKVFYCVNDLIKNDDIKIAVSVPKKRFKRAVDRNKIKRLCKEAYRLNKHLIWDKIKDKNKQLCIMFVYLGDDLPSYPEVEEKIKSILNRFDLNDQE